MASTMPNQHRPSPERFQEEVFHLVNRYTRIWGETGADTPEFDLTFDRQRQRMNESETDLLLDYLEREIEHYPDTPSERDAWRAKILSATRRFGILTIGFPERCFEILFSKHYLHSTRDFVHRATSFDRSIPIEALFQALRNVWIMNSIQIFLDREPAMSPAIFAYSMLYPYTDEYLDDPGVPLSAKNLITSRLALRLRGDDLVPDNPRERDVFRLVSLIEQEYPRGDFPDAYFSLLAIHQAQVRSLLQQEPVPSAGLDETLRISAEKGGTSVLADGYLVAGFLNKEEADFFFGFGVLLQLLDDLQDVRQDLELKHWTIFSRTGRASRLDHLTNRLVHFMNQVLRSTSRFSAPRFAPLKDLIQRSCVFLLLRALAENREFFSDDYLRAMETYSPVGFAYLRDRNSLVEKKYRRVKKILLEAKGMDSMFAILD